MTFPSPEDLTLIVLRFGAIPLDGQDRIAYIHRLPEDFKRKYEYIDEYDDSILGKWIFANRRHLTKDLADYIRTRDGT